MTTYKKEDFDSLECPQCGNLTKPKRVNKDGSVRYECTRYQNHNGGQGDLGGVEKWTITENGDLKE